MRKFTKSLLTLALLVLVVGGANSKTLNVNLSALPAQSENTTWTWNAETSTGTFAWSDVSYNSTELFGSGNYSTYETLKIVSAEGTANHFRIIFKFTNGTNQITITPVAVGTTSINLTDYVSLEDLAAVSTIRISGANDITGNITVSSIYLEGPDITYIEATEVFEAPAGTKDINDLTGTNTNWKKEYPATLKGEAAALQGDGDGNVEASHVTIEGYDYLCFHVPSVANGSSDLRIWIWDDVNSKVVTLRPHPIADYKTVNNWEAAYSIASPGTYVAKVSGYKYLKGMKTNWGSNANLTIASAYLSKDVPVEYVPTGKYTLVGETPGSVTLNAALSDVNATSYNAIGLTGTNVALEPANPNALFIANEGTLTNTKNVIVDGTCANLVLEDKKPFKAPVAFTATDAKFTKTVGDADYATMVLPFAVETLPNGVEVYNITGNEDDVLTTTKAETIEANKPVMLKNAGTYEFTASGAAIAATATGVQTNGLLNGAYAATAVPTENSYVLQNQSGDVNFYKAVAGLTIDPFRAYLTTATAGARLSFDFDQTTGIKTVETAKDVNVYNLQGVRVANPTKGLYIVNGKKAIVK